MPHINATVFATYHTVRVSRVCYTVGIPLESFPNPPAIAIDRVKMAATAALWGGEYPPIPYPVRQDYGEAFWLDDGKVWIDVTLTYESVLAGTQNFDPEDPPTI